MTISAEDWMGMYGVASRRAEAAEAEVKRLREASRWIPVSERVPQECEDVIVSAKDRVCFAYTLTIDDEVRWCYNERQVEGVTHWRPLPEGPC